MVRFLCLSLLLFLTFQFHAQQTYIFGGGHNTDVDVFSSSDYIRANWDQEARAENTINGAGLDGARMDASRFLAQATLGANERLIDDVVYIGFEGWIENQFEIEPTLYMEVMSNTYTDIFDLYITDGGDPNNFRCRPKWYQSNYAWWEMIMTGEDLLRQRIALALSEILVASKSRSDIEDHGFAVASYYDVFIKNAFGNYKDILMEVSLHPSMGIYLSHLNNPKADPEANTFPDENFAREMMQLFSIGVHLLNIDGSLKLNQNGMPIPAYTLQESSGMAKVFTGLGGGGISECSDAFAPAFGLDIHHIDMTVPMIMFEDFHDNGPKTIAGGFAIPAGQNGMKDIKDAINHIFNHPNAAPFISQKLIKFFVTSNPSPAYVERVANAFNDNGNGIKGDMKTIIKAILLDSEARSCDAMLEPSHGKMREPILRYTHFAKAMDLTSSSGHYWEEGGDLMEATGQHPMHSPHVFNFFSPDYTPSGPLEEAGLVAPEFQLHNSVTSTRYFNIVNDWTSYEELFHNREYNSNQDRHVYLDIARLVPLSREPEVLLNQIDLLLLHGQLTDQTRTILRQELEKYEEEQEGAELLYHRTLMALYVSMISPDYVIFK